MGFVTLEDIQGNIDLVLFPKTWQKTREQLTVGQIVIVEGKADTGSSPPKILVDEIKTEIKILEPLVEPVNLLIPAKPAVTEPTQNETQFDEQVTQPVRQNNPVRNNIPVKPTVPPPMRQVAETPIHVTEPASAPNALAPDGGWDDMPPPPDNFPDDWKNEWQPSFENAEIAARPEPKPSSAPVVQEPPLRNESVEPGTKHSEHVNTTRETEAVQPTPTVSSQPLDFLPSLYIPLAQEDPDKDHPPKQITVIMRSTGDKEHDKRRIKTIFGTLISFHGRDRFSFQIYENGKGHLIDFPNDTTQVCSEVLERLKKLLGEESLRVEEITFQ
jgi:hypothetical protein